MPQLGESVTEGTIARWLKAEGDEIEKDEPLAEVDTDKVNAELPSPVAGKIEKLLVSEGTTVDVGTEIVLVAVDGDESPSAEATPREDVADEAPTEEWPVAHTEAQPAVQKGEKQRAVAEALRLRRSSPVVRRLAEEHDVDISEISGTGTGGRVTKKDIESFIEGRATERETVPAAAATETERVAVHDGDRVVELTSIRRTIANRMAVSKAEIPHAWTLVEVDMTGLAALREKEKAAFAEREGVRLTYLPFIIKAAVEGLKEQPVLNSVWDGDR